MNQVYSDNIIKQDGTDQVHKTGHELCISTCHLQLATALLNAKQEYVKYMQPMTVI